MLYYLLCSWLKPCGAMASSSLDAIFKACLSAEDLKRSDLFAEEDVYGKHNELLKRLLREFGTASKKTLRQALKRLHEFHLHKAPAWEWQTRTAMSLRRHMTRVRRSARQGKTGERLPSNSAPLVAVVAQRGLLAGQRRLLKRRSRGQSQERELPRAPAAAS